MTEAPAGGSLSWRRLYRIVRATTGWRLSARVRFLDLSAFGATFDARSDPARRAVPEPFELIEHAPGRTLLTALAFDAHIVDRLAPHRALALTLPVRYRGARGSFPIRVPVTTDEARWTGVELYGFPAFVANVREERDLDTHIARLSIEGRPVLTLRVGEQPVADDHARVRLLSIRDDARVVGSTLRIDGEAARSDVSGGATLSPGDHPLADLLRELDVATESRSQFVFPHAMAVLSRARILGRAARPIDEARPALRPSPA